MHFIILLAVTGSLILCIINNAFPAILFLKRLPIVKNISDRLSWGRFWDVAMTFYCRNEPPVPGSVIDLSHSWFWRYYSCAIPTSTRLLISASLGTRRYITALRLSLATECLFGSSALFSFYYFQRGDFILLLLL